MQTTDALVQEIDTLKKKRKVTFSEDVVDHEQPIIFSKKRKKEPHYARMKKNVLRYLFEGKYEELDIYLKSYTAQEVEAFYKQKGGILLSWAIIDANTSMPLKFLMDNISPVITTSILCDDNSSLLKNFSGGQCIADQYGRFSQERKTDFIEKLQVLLDSSNTEIYNVIERIGNANFITSNVKPCFDAVKFQKEENKSKFLL